MTTKDFLIGTGIAAVGITAGLYLAGAFNNEEDSDGDLFDDALDVDYEDGTIVVWDDEDCDW